MATWLWLHGLGCVATSWIKNERKIFDLYIRILDFPTQDFLVFTIKEQEFQKYFPSHSATII